MKQIIMWILNITPDSFFDGGKYLNIEDALQQIQTMQEQWVDIIDVWGFSSRPGSIMPSVQVELSRIIPVLDILEEKKIFFSVDTCRSEVIKNLLCYTQLKYINDISGLQDEKILDLISGTDIWYILMHTQWAPNIMQNSPKYNDVVQEVYSFFEDKIQLLTSKGISNIILDPGFWFWKTIQHNYQILDKLHIFQSLKYPLLVGLSYKSMIWKPLYIPFQEVWSETVALNMLALEKWAHILRVHDIAVHSNIIELFQYLKQD